jgi:hypothetical protein
MSLTQRQEAAQQRIHELLAELVEIVGPDSDGQAGYEPGEGPSGNPTLWEWVTVCCWVDDAQQDWVTIVPASGMLSHHISGLLRDAERQHGNYDQA